jgi:uncharacterized membrane protein YbjE (DUF340 family)
MASLVSLVLLFIFLFAGMLFARIPGLRKSALYVDRINTMVLWVLLFLMGFRLGRDEEVGDKLLQIGIISVVFALAAVVGTMLTLFLMKKCGFLGKTSTEAGKGGGGSSFIAHLHEPVRLFLIVLIGFLLGFFLPFFPGFTGERATSFALYTLLFFIGMALVLNGVNIRKGLFRRETLLLPLGTIFGTLLGGGAAGLFLDISLGKSLAVVSGFGWYSLSGVLITDLGDPFLGSAGFMANLIRESVALLIIPFLGKVGQKEVAIGIAGATSMDVSLPVIERSCGTWYVPLSISHGAIISFVVPVLVPILFHIG